MRADGDAGAARRDVGVDFKVVGARCAGNRCRIQYRIRFQHNLAGIAGMPNRRLLRDQLAARLASLNIEGLLTLGPLHHFENNLLTFLQEFEAA